MYFSCLVILDIKNYILFLYIKGGTERSKRYLKVQEVHKGLRGALRSKRYLKVQDIPKDSKGNERSNKYLGSNSNLKIQEGPIGPKGP